MKKLILIVGIVVISTGTLSFAHAQVVGEETSLGALASLLQGLQQQVQVLTVGVQQFFANRSASNPYLAQVVPSSDMWVYQDSFVAPWNSAGWSGVSNYANTEQVYAGLRSIKTVATAWGGVSFQSWSNPQNVSGYASLQFAVYPTSSFAANVTLNGPNAFTSANVSRSLIANQWNIISIDISSFAIPNGQLIDRVNIGGDSQPRTYYTDNVEFVAGSGGVVDATPPSVPSGLLATPVSSSQINLSWSVSTDNVGVTGYRVYRNGSQIVTVTTGSSYQDTSLTANTTYSYTVSAYDAAGNASSQSSSVNGTTQTTSLPPVGDIIPPTISLSAPTSGATVSGNSVTVSANASDNVGVVGVQFLLDGATLSSEDTSSPYSITWNTTGVSNGSHTLSARARDAAGNQTTATNISVTVSNTVVPPPPAATSTFWLTAYYPTWAMMPLGAATWAIPPNQVNWTGITHVVHFMSHGNVDPNTAPYFTPMIPNNPDAIEYQYNGIANPMCGPTCWIDFQRQLLNSVHAAGGKVLVNVHAVDAANLNAIVADQTKTDVFADAAVSYAEQKGYDGVEVNWESWITGLAPKDQVSRLIIALRNRMDRSSTVKLLTLAPQSGHYNYYDSAVTNSRVDQINMQMYDIAYAWNPSIGANGAWFINPLYKGTVPSGFEGASFQTRGPLQWMAVGHNPKKLGPGVSTYGWVFKNTDQMFQAYANGPGYAKYQDATRLLNNGGVNTWDDARKAEYISGTALRTEGNTGWGQPGVTAGQKFWVTYQTPRAIQEEVAWVKTQGFGGIMLYDMTMDLDNTLPFGQRNPIHNAAVSAMGQ